LSAWILPNDNKQTIGSNAIFSLLAFHSSIIVSKMFTERRGAGGGGGGEWAVAAFTKYIIIQ
jgi:hypothetical protein